MCCTDVGESLDLLPELTKLNMNGCVSLTRLVLTNCIKLKWLDCSGGALMHHIHAFSPALSHVRAVACHRLVVSLAAALCNCVCGCALCWCQESVQMETQTTGGFLEQWNTQVSCCNKQQQDALHLKRLQRMHSPVSQSIEISQCETRKSLLMLKQHVPSCTNEVPVTYQPQC